VESQARTPDWAGCRWTWLWATTRAGCRRRGDRACKTMAVSLARLEFLPTVRKTGKAAEGRRVPCRRRCHAIRVHAWIWRKVLIARVVSEVIVSSPGQPVDHCGKHATSGSADRRMDMRPLGWRAVLCMTSSFHSFIKVSSFLPGFYHVLCLHYKKLLVINRPFSLMLRMSS